MAGVEPQAYRRALGRFPTGVTVVTTRDPDGRPVGLTCSSFSALSLDPPLILWSLRSGARCCPVFRSAERFAVNILSAGQAGLSRRFASPEEDRFAGVETRDGLGGVPLIEGCSARLECRTQAVHPGGDHLIIVGRVERLDTAERDPLVYCRGTYMLAEPHPGA